MLLTVLFVSSFTFSQIVTKNGERLEVKGKLNSSNILPLASGDSLNKSELVNVYRYLVELQKVRSDYAIELKKNLLLNQQNSAYQNQIELQSDMMRNLEVYAEQVKPEWWQSEYAIVAWVVGACALTFLITN